MTPTPVTPAPETPPPAPTPAGPTKEEFEALREQVEQATRAAQFWQERATSGKPDPKPEEKKDDDVDLLEVITTRGVKGFDELMRSRGYVSKAEVDQVVNSRAEQMRAEQELYADYPELKNTKGEFFLATAVEYANLVKSGVPEAMAMRLAARNVELEGIKGGKIKTPKELEAERKAEREKERQERIRAQGGDRSGRMSSVEDEGDDELTPEQKAIAIKMLAGDGVTEQQAIEMYQKRAKAGVRMSARGGR